MPIMADSAPMPSSIIMPATSNVARDPAIAVAEEFNAAVRQGTVDALDLFIARHPNSAYAGQASKLRAEILERRDRR